MTIETVAMVILLATGEVKAYPPTTYDECMSSRHVIAQWARVIRLRRSGHLAVGGVPVIGAECLPIELTPCEEGS